MVVNPELQPNFGPFADNQQHPLMNYLQSLDPDLVAQLSQPQSPEITKVMEQNITSLIGNLPGGHFDVRVTTSKENLGRLLASAMISGYFLKSAELRYSFERSLQPVGADAESSNASSPADESAEL
jgi:hypothetical protein